MLKQAGNQNQLHTLNQYEQPTLQSKTNLNSQLQNYYTMCDFYRTAKTGQEPHNVKLAFNIRLLVLSCCTIVHFVSVIHVE